MSTITTVQDIQDKVRAGELFVLTRQEMEALLPWLDVTLKQQPKEADNVQACQVLSTIFRISRRLYGTPEHTAEHCICEG